MSLAANDPRHGTVNGYNNHKCRCTVCRRAWADCCMDRNRRKGIRPRDVVLAEMHAKAEARDNHGTTARYSFGCRCDACKAASAAARNKRRKAIQNPSRHGVAWVYANGCRCDECREAWKLYKRARKAAA